MSEYHIDAYDRLVFVDDTWREFAKDNGAPELANDAILNQSLWNFVSNKEVVHLYQIILDKVRQYHKPLQIHYRCDAPDTRRVFQMNIEVNEDQIIRFCNQLIHKESREPVNLFEPTTERSEETIHICSWCKRVKVIKETWIEVEEAIELLGLFEAEKMPQISHGMCPICLKDIKNQIEEQFH